MPIIVAYLVWAGATWMAGPLFNLLLLMDPFGRLALSRDEKISAAGVGLCVLGGLLSIAAAVAGLGPGCLPAALVCLLMIPAVSRYDQFEPGYPRGRMIALAAGLALAGVAAVTCISLGVPDGSPLQRRFAELGNTLMIGFILGAFASQFFVNSQAGAPPNSLTPDASQADPV